MTRRLVVDPRFDPHYHSYFIVGFRRLGYEIELDHRAFPAPTDFAPRGMRAIVVQGSSRLRLYLAADDRTSIDADGLAWCDRYGAVNVRPDVLAEGEAARKLVPLGPAFGVRAWAPAHSTALALRTFRASRDVRAPREHVHLWRAQAARLPIDAYAHGESDPSYIFFAGWLWKKHGDVNPPRERFLAACRAVDGVHVEGGFPARRRDDVPGYEHALVPRSYPISEYLAKTRRSAVVFASPAVHGCLGWKLGEFLALGKAVVTVGFDRALPRALEHGVQVHAVEDDVDSIRGAVDLLVRDHAYRRSLEDGARRWFDEWSSPVAMAARLTADHP